MKTINRITIPVLAIIMLIVFCGQKSTEPEETMRFNLVSSYQMDDSCMDVYTDHIYVTTAGNKSGIQIFRQQEIQVPEPAASYDSLIGKAVAVDANSSFYIIGIAFGNDSCALATYDYCYFPYQGSEYWGFCTLPYPIEDAKAWGSTYAFVAHGEYGVSIIDLADSLNPQLINTFDTPGEAHGLCLSGPRIFIADGSAGIQHYDISDPANPVLINSCDTPGEAYAIEINPSYTIAKAYVADGTAGLLVIDSIYSNPVIASRLETPGLARDLSLNYELHFPGVKEASIFPDIISILSRLGTCVLNNPMPIWDRGYILIADGSAGFQAIRIEDYHPVGITATFETSSYARHVSNWFSCDNNMYFAIADCSSELKIIELVEIE